MAFDHGGGGSAAPPPQKPVDQAELDRQASEKAAEQRTLSQKRKGYATTRLTDPVAALNNQDNSAKRGVSLLGGRDPNS